MDAAGPARFSIVIPTFNRKNVLLRSLAALGQMRSSTPFEVIVVDDGSSDGTTKAITKLSPNYTFVVLTQRNSGAGAARNFGASHANGEFLLFLDDDMIADQNLLLEHEKALKLWDAAVGHIPVDECSPPSALKIGLERWVKIRHERLSRNDAELQLGDLLTGQLSVRAEVFHRLGGFDDSFNRHGTFGAEDTDFLYRLLQSGARATYLPSAISHQHYVVTPPHYLRQWAQGGRADAALIRKHPALRLHVAAGHGGALTQWMLGARSSWLVSNNLLDRCAARIVPKLETGKASRATQWAFTRVRDALYWRNFDAADGGVAPFRLSVIAYHSIGAEPGLGSGAVTSTELSMHLAELDHAGFSVISLSQALEYLGGKPLAGPSVLLTFDDGYQSVHQQAAPILRDSKLPAVAFAVSGQLGGTNRWDELIGHAGLPLMTAIEFDDLHNNDWALAGHTHSHPHLTQLSARSLLRELNLSVQNLQHTGAPHILAYPYGEHDGRVRRATARAGYRYAFALGGGVASTKTRDRFRIARTEIVGGMSGIEVIAAMTRCRATRKGEFSRELRGLIHQILPFAGSKLYRPGHSL